MINELFSFQKAAVNDLRKNVAMALNNYRNYRVPQVISLQAPTGSGKTIIMASLIEDIFFGSEIYLEQPDAIFVWLSDSPQLNEQSKQKIEQKADRIRFDQCVVISDESFDQEMLDEGHIYFLNTQKLGKGANLSYHSDEREYTIWETIENTIREKYDRLYFIIDEAHRGMQGRAAGTATTIMQRFIKGSKEYNLSPMPVVIGMSATAERFNSLIGTTTSTLNKTVITPAQVRASGLLKDRIVITYPDDPTKHGDMAVLQAATDEWIDKCQHWYQYTYEQHYPNVNPVFVIQVLASSGNKVSDTDLDDVIGKIEERVGTPFLPGEVVHTFGSTGTIEINGLSVPHIEPSEITENRKIKVVLFKENLSTGWDCPRAETMMSFRKAEDATYIAQLLGRMVRTPLQCHVNVDDSLNDVRLYLPYFNKNTVKSVIDELQSSEGGEIPTDIEGESLGEQTFVPWTVHTKKYKKDEPIEGQIGIDTLLASQTDLQKSKNGTNSEPETKTVESESEKSGSSLPLFEFLSSRDALSTDTDRTIDNDKKANVVVNEPLDKDNQDVLSEEDDIDREAVIRFINEQGFLNYVIRDVRVTRSYLSSLLSLAGLLTHNLIYVEAKDEVENEIVSIIRNHITDLHNSGKYDDLARQVLEFKLSMQIYDVFGETIKDYSVGDLLMTTESDLDRQLKAADARMCSYGFSFIYGRRYIDFDNPNQFKIDYILFAADDNCIAKINTYAEKKFHDLNDKYRKYVVSKSEKCKREYSTIVEDGDRISKHNFSLPETINGRNDKDGTLFTDHLFADVDGNATIKLNSWEEGVLAEEQKRSDFVTWLRNVPREKWALRLPYEIDGITKTTYPDFIIIRKDDVLGYVMDILEPHNPDFKDNLAKAKAFAKYAEVEQRIGRIELIRTGKDAAGKLRFKRLDLAKGSVRNKVLSAINNDELDHIFDIDGQFGE